MSNLLKTAMAMVGIIVLVGTVSYATEGTYREKLQVQRVIKEEKAVVELTQEQQVAVEKALKKYKPAGKRIEGPISYVMVEQDEDDELEIEVIIDGVKYELEIDLATGKVTEIDKDDLDDDKDDLDDDKDDLDDDKDDLDDDVDDLDDNKDDLDDDKDDDNDDDDN